MTPIETVDNNHKRCGEAVYCEPHTTVYMTFKLDAGKCPFCNRLLHIG